ncbi:ISLre2-like element ISNth2 family transposase [Natranaerobius thermophilus]|uniref:ISLre2 family transposase n=1 Tax=Natranaerobius thermophilus (strain ATCC BAA-1301 / DSM 18059 / JW/NM-WN-LF) TaxID=457570 RepID=B2A168_NATTJ|nr:ISLre2-like element ISNth2 family transposase [Natranaerobius thermophilus]ACB84735.1 protein of unknown function UPF0236 [Natranaerobius thermophilus JW/NM-WN-LF]ACB86009.1 protein of unknown function UPF0236 [Natranaerobius thermophilus JW/NM-WN-LF]ACB86188.1 protein of unknown function UPF0236 [Natranaerobius thermophilus JW/NM-WN-LF]
MEIIQLVEEKILQVSEKVLNVLDGEIEYDTFTKLLKEELDGLGSDILKEVLEALDAQIKENRRDRKGWVVERKADPKSILTPFGDMVYNRTYYKNKETGEYKYLADEKAGITSHMRVDSTLKSDIADAATKVSYEKATEEVSRFNQDLKLSKQTVANTVKEFELEPLEQPEEKKKVSNLYIEADEDHLSMQTSKRSETKLIYVHEGIKGKKRRSLKNCQHFTTITESPDKFWLTVCDYIESHYDTKDTNIFISGDGAKWIRVGEEYIPNATYILDKFHLSKYIIAATGHAPKLRRQIYKNIKNLDQEAVFENLQEALTKADTEARQKRIMATIKYIKNNWDGIEASVNHPEVGCSAEGHVSHILASRMSSRPMAWSEKGATKMAEMLATKANGKSVKEAYLSTKGRQEAEIVNLQNQIKQELKKLTTKKKLGKANNGNVPLMNGKYNLTRTAIKGLNRKQII